MEMLPPLDSPKQTALPLLQRVTWPHVGTLLGWLVGVGLLVGVLLFFQDVVILLGMVLSAAYALHAPFTFLHQRLASVLPTQWPTRLMALVVLVVALVGVVAPSGYALWMALKADSRQFLTDAPMVLQRLGLSGAGINNLGLHGDGWAEVVKTMGEWLVHSIAHGLHGIAGLILVVYLLLDGNNLRLGIQRSLPATLQALAQTSHGILKAYVQEQLLVSLLTGVVMTLVYMGLGLKYAVLLGVFNGVASCLPVAGPWIGLLPGVLICLSGQHPDLMGWLLLWAGGWYLFKEYVLLPYLIGNVLEIHPVIVIVAFLACMEMFGLLGALFLALPLASVLSALGRWWAAMPSATRLTTSTYANSTPTATDA
jgi:predicted PurR-regulated permease PerM